MTRYARLIFVCLALCLSSGCITRNMWRWANEPIRKGRVEGIIHESDGSDRVIFTFNNCEGLDAAAYYQVVVPKDWKALPIRSFQDKYELREMLPLNEYVKQWEKIGTMGSRVYPRKLKHILREVKKAPLAKPGRTAYALVKHRAEDGLMLDDLFAYHPEEKRWVQIGRVEIGYGARAGGRKFAAVLLTPFTFIVDIPLTIIKVAGIGILAL